MPSVNVSAPSTPSRQFSFLPAHSSPLAPSAASSPSPISAAQARRRSQYKSQSASSPSFTRTARRPTASTSRLQPPSDGLAPAEEPPAKAFLRERFKARCLERAQKDRARKLSGRRQLSEPSSDGFDEFMECEDEEDDEEILNDELFKRIMSSVNHKRKHEYRLSYAQDVGSSFDPDMEDVGQWEDDLQLAEPVSTVPDDLDEEEFAVYAEEYELALDTLPEHELWSLSDVDDVPNPQDHDELRLKGKEKEKGTAYACADDVEMSA